MSWPRHLAALGLAASLAAPLAADAAPVAGAGRASGTFSVSAVVVRSAPVALRAASAELERAGPPAPQASARQIPLSGARTGPSGLPSGARAAVVFIDGAPPSWVLRARSARASARAELGAAMARR